MSRGKAVMDKKLLRLMMLFLVGGDSPRTQCKLCETITNLRVLLRWLHLDQMEPISESHLSSWQPTQLTAPLSDGVAAPPDGCASHDAMLPRRPWFSGSIKLGVLFEKTQEWWLLLLWLWFNYDVIIIVVVVIRVMTVMEKWHAVDNPTIILFC